MCYKKKNLLGTRITHGVFGLAEKEGMMFEIVGIVRPC